MINVASRAPTRRDTPPRRQRLLMAMTLDTYGSLFEDDLEASPTVSKNASRMLMRHRGAQNLDYRRCPGSGTSIGGLIIRWFQVQVLPGPPTQVIARCCQTENRLLHDSTGSVEGPPRPDLLALVELATAHETPVSAIKLPRPMHVPVERESTMFGPAVVVVRLVGLNLVLHRHKFGTPA